jgi:hypothetical protein
MQRLQPGKPEHFFFFPTTNVPQLFWITDYRLMDIDDTRKSPIAARPGQVIHEQA